MNQEKTGKFIAELRKRQNRTQEDLAKSLGITKNAVSKWERGLSFPDVSLYKKLCQELDTTIEELINGGPQDKNGDKKSNSHFTKQGTIIIIIATFGFLAIILSLLYYSHRHKINFITDADYLYEEAIAYLRDQELRSSPDAHKLDFNVFYSYHGFGIENKDNEKRAYMWIYSQGYYVEEGDVLAIASGKTSPCKVTFKDDEIIKIEYPEMGDAYRESVEKMFPQSIAEQVLTFATDANIDKLFKEISDKKSIYYDYLNLDMRTLTIDDISFNDLIFSITVGNKDCVPVQLSIYKDHKYVFNTAYEACRPGVSCTMMLKYTQAREGKYDYDIMQIVKHSVDANNEQYIDTFLLKYKIFTGSGHQFITDDDNKYLHEFLNLLDIDLNSCAEPDYVA